MNTLPIEIFQTIVDDLSLTDWKCLRLTCRLFYIRLSSLKSYSRTKSILLKPQPEFFNVLLEKVPVNDIEHLSLFRYNYEELCLQLNTSPYFKHCLKNLQTLSFSQSMRLIDSFLFSQILNYCENLVTLDLSLCKYFFLTENFLTHSQQLYSTVKNLNLNGNSMMSDYYFNQLTHVFPNLESLHLLGIHIRSSTLLRSSTNSRTIFSFENLSNYFLKQSQLHTVSLTFEHTLLCDDRICHLLFYQQIEYALKYLHLDGFISVQTLTKILFHLGNSLETIIINHLQLPECYASLFDSLCEYGKNLKTIRLDIKPAVEMRYVLSTREPMPAITLDPLIHLEDLDIQNMYSLTENELIQLFNESSVSRKKFQYLKKLSLPRYATDNIIALISRSTYSLKLTCLNLSSCSSITNRTVIFITKYMHNLIELNLSYCLNITDFALFGIPIKTNEKLIDWLDEQEIRKQFINDLISLSPTIFKYSEIHDQQVCHCTQINVSSKCAYLTLDYSKKSSFESILSILTNNQLFLKYFHPIKKLKQLKRLYLKQCIQLTDLILFYALEFPTLEILDLSYCELLTDKYLHLIGENNPCLELINIINCRNISEYGEEQLKMNAKRLKLFED